MLLTYHISFTKDTYVRTYFAEIKGIDQKFGFKRIFMKAETYDYGEGRAHYISIHQEGVFEQSIKVYSKATRKIIRCERKWFAYDGYCLHEIKRREVLNLLKRLKEISSI